MVGVTDDMGGCGGVAGGTGGGLARSVTASC